MAEMVKVVTLETVKRGKKYVAPGAVLEVTAREAASLKRLNVAADAPADAVPAAPAKPEGDALHDAINGAVSQLDSKNDEHFTSRGKPIASAVAQVLGYAVSTAEVTAAIAAAKAKQ